MKNYFKIIMLTVLMTVACGTTFAQTNSKQRISREELAQKQAKHIAESMAMDNATTTKFVETYCNCQKEIWALGPRLGKNAHNNAQTKTDAETEQDIKARFERSEKILNIRQKYYKEYSKFLTQKQINQVYELERQTMNRLSKRGGKGNFKGRPAAKHNGAR